MNFVDFTLCRLADPGLRASILDQNALQQIVTAAYDAGAADVSGPFEASFDRVSLGLLVRSRVSFQGVWGERSDPQRHQVALQLEAANGAVRVDAFWQGAVTVSSNARASSVNRVDSRWIDTAGIDDEIAAALGSLPTEPQVLEVERRTRLMARWRGAASQPEALNDAVIARWLDQQRVASIAELFDDQVRTRAGGVLQVGFSSETSGNSVRMQLPVSAALLVRDQPIDLGGLLMQTRLARQALETQGAERPSTAALSRRTQLVAVWVLPAATFEDSGWPGSAANDSGSVARAKRLDAARAWLAPEGIAVVPFSQTAA